MSEHPGRPRGGTLLGAIDIGSNAVRFAVARLDVRGGLSMVEERRRPTRLGANLAAGTGLPKAGVKATIGAVKEFCFDALRAGVSHSRVVATAAVREAPDGPDFVRRLEREIGMPVEVIGPDEEARLAFSSCASAFDLRRQHVAIVDIGGGSVQVSLVARGVLYDAVSMPLGAVRLTRRFGTGEQSKMERHVERVLRDSLNRPSLPPSALIGCGGTFATIGAFLGDLPGRAPLKRALSRPSRSLRTLGHSADVLGRIAERLEEAHVDQRAGMLRRIGVPPDRADILPAGLVVACALVAHLRVGRIVPHAGGVRDGLLREMASARTSGAANGMVDRARSIARAAGYEVAHSEQVAHLAIALLHDLADVDRVHEALADRSDASELLESAGLLHDIGVPIDYDRHHKVSRRMIELADWGGIGALERAIIANAARYHRKSLPKPSHAPFMALPPGARQAVRVLAGILRIADGLDRSHRQQTTGVRIRVTPASLRIVAEGAEPDGPDIRAAQKKSDLLCAAIRRRITVVAG